MNEIIHGYVVSVILTKFRINANIQLWQSFSILNFEIGIVSDFLQYINPCSGYQDYNALTQKQAEELINLLSNKHFLSSLAFMLDTQEVFREHSLFYQQKEETIIGQAERRTKFIRSLKKLRRKGSGIWTKELLREHSKTMQGTSL